MLIDSHTHLSFPEFKNDVEEVIARAQDAGVEKMIVPAINLESSREAVALAEKFPSVFAAVAVHPHDSQDFQRQQLQVFYEMAQHPKVVAIGEIGLDYFRDYAPQAVQKEVFRTFLEVAKETHLPVIIHNRAAFKEVCEIIREPDFLAISGVFHCFSEDENAAWEVIELGFVVSFTGTITFPKSRSAAVAQKVPLSRQLLETDSPYMAPVPWRGKRNEPAFVKFVAEKQAELHETSIEETGRLTTGLAHEIFAKLKQT